MLRVSALRYSPTAKKTASQKDGDEATGENFSVSFVPGIVNAV